MDFLEGGLHGAHLRVNVIDQIGPAAYRRAMRERTLTTTHAGVVVDARRQPALLTRCAAVVLALGPRCALSGPTAAELHGCGAAATVRTHVLVPYGSHQRSRPGLVVRRRARY